MQRGAIFGRRGLGAGDIVAIGLVDGDHVGKLDHALLQALQLIAGARQHEQQKKVGHVGDRDFRLADPDRLDQHHVIACSLAEQHGLAGFCRHAAEGAGSGGGADEGVGVVGEVGHAGFVGEDRSAGAPRRRIDREHRNLATLFGQHGAQRIDGGRFADARRAGDADPHRVAGRRQKRLGQRGGGAAVIGAFAFDQRNGARKQGTIAGTDVARQAVHIGKRDGRRHDLSSASIRLPSSIAQAQVFTFFHSRPPARPDFIAE